MTEAALYVYTYQYVDDLRFIRNASLVLTEDGLSEPQIENIIKKVKNIFLEKGWNGDGELGVIWLPPFLYDEGNTLGNYLWHVKQNRGGVSFIATSHQISFYCFSYDSDNDLSFGMRISGKTLLDSIDENYIETQENIEVLNTIGENAKRITNKIIIFSQGDIVSKFQHYLDMCYLSCLQERFINHNPNIKITINKIKLTDIPDRTNDYAESTLHQRQWLVQADIVSCLWHEYMKLSFKDKIFALNYALTQDKKIEKNMMTIKIHIELRNAIQHCQGILTSDTLRRLELKGKKFITLSNDRKINIGDVIVFTQDDIRALVEAIKVIESSIQFRSNNACKH